MGSKECQFFYKLFEIDDLPPRGSGELERTLGLLNTEDYVLYMRMLILPGPLYILDQTINIIEDFLPTNVSNVILYHAYGTFTRIICS